jgi:hypothetical protein
LIREYKNSRQIAVEFIKTEEQLVDFLTKPLGREKFSELCSKIGPISVSDRGIKT